MTDYALSEETLGYVTAEDPSNTDKRYLRAGSRDTLIDFNRKVGIRNGFTRLGAGNDALTEVRNGFTWNTSNGVERPLRFYDDEWEVYLGTVDEVEIDAWTRFASSMNTENTPRGAAIFDATENIDLMILVEGTDNLHEWNGAVAVVASITGTTITKAGTSTFAQSRFYTTRNKVVVCVRTGTEYTYTAGEASLTLTGIADTAGLVAGDILVQKKIATDNAIASGRNNDTIYAFENQIIVGSFDDNESYISHSDDYADFAFGTPRLAGEGALLTLDGPSRGFGAIGSYLLAFAGPSSIFRADYEQIAVGEVLAETLRVKRLDTGVNQGSLNPDCIVPIGNALAYLSNEVALRVIENPDSFDSIDPKTFSNPIKPDFDAEDWTGAKGTWHKNAIWFCAPANSHNYALQFVEDADGKVRRFWQPPQVLPVNAFSIIDSALHGHSNAVPETYQLFNPNRFSDLIVNGDNDEPDDKLPINGIAKRVYQSYGKRGQLKCFDEYYVEGEITTNTNDLDLGLEYDFSGATQEIHKTIDGSDEGVLEGNIDFNSLAQQALAQNPLGGLLNPPRDARKFRVVFEIAKEDFHELAASFETNEVDRYWAIIADGANATLSPRRDTSIRR
jgi:hypothetical protein